MHGARLALSLSRDGRGVIAPATVAAVGLAAAVAIFVDGGFSAETRAAFAALAGLAALLATLYDQNRAVAAARSWPVAMLAGLAIVTAISAAWTLGSPLRAERWALVLAGYAAMVIAAATISSVRPRVWLPMIIASISIAAGVAGLAGLPFATEMQSKRRIADCQAREAGDSGSDAD